MGINFKLLIIYIPIKIKQFWVKTWLLLPTEYYYSNLYYIIGIYHTKEILNVSTI